MSSSKTTSNYSNQTGRKTSGILNWVTNPFKSYLHIERYRETESYRETETQRDRDRVKETRKCTGERESKIERERKSKVESEGEGESEREKYLQETTKDYGPFQKDHIKISQSWSYIHYNYKNNNNKHNITEKQKLQALWRLKERRH